MIITDEFVMLNLPKTGSSFVRAALKRIHKYDTLPSRTLRALNLEDRLSMQELILPAIDKASIYGTPGQHGTYRQVPKEHRHKMIMSIMRDPFDRYVSDYLFGWWKRFPPTDEAQLRSAFPHFPDLSFEEYCEMNNRFGRKDRLGDLAPKIDLGLFTIQFVQFYFKDPETVLNALDDDYIFRRMVRTEMAPVVFLHRENLNQELYEFLLSAGYPPEEIDFILEAEKVNVTPRSSCQVDTTEFVTQELREEILKKDRLLFELFPEYLPADLDGPLQAKRSG